MILVADGIVTLAAGTDVTTSSLQSGVNGQDNTLGGTLNIGPGTSLLVQDTFVIGNTAGGGAISHGIINQTGGTVDVNAQNTDGRNFVLGHWGTGQGTYNLSAGTLTSPNISMAISWDGDGAFNLSDTGVANVLGLRFGHNPGRSGVFNLTGGELNLGAEGIWAENGGFPNDINLGGGIVRAMASAPITEPVELTGTNGDVTFDTNGNTLTVTGALSGTGGFIKTGAGRMVLNASNSATGIFTVNAGTLSLVGDYAGDRIPANGIVQVNNGSTLEFGSVNVVAPDANYFVNPGSTLTNAAGVNHVHVGAVQLNGATWTTDPASGSYDGENYQFDGATISVVGTAPSFITQQGGTAADRGISWLTTATFDVADVTGNSAADLIVSTELENADSGAAALVKTGAGTMKLAFTNSYTGSTTVSAGTLEFAVSQTLTSLIIADGATAVITATPPPPFEDSPIVRPRYWPGSHPRAWHRTLLAQRVRCPAGPPASAPVRGNLPTSVARYALAFPPAHHRWPCRGWIKRARKLPAGFIRDGRRQTGRHRGRSPAILPSMHVALRSPLFPPCARAGALRLRGTPRAGTGGELHRAPVAV